MTLPKVEPLHQGNRFYRTDDEKCTNPRERAFAEEWNRINTSDPLGWSLLDRMVDENQEHSIEPGYGGSWDRMVQSCTERDHMIAATVIQWLGSNVGQGFLERTIPIVKKAHDKWRETYDALQAAEHKAIQRRAEARRRAKSVNP